MALIRVGIVRGGPSHEYEVSIKTGGHLLKMLNSEPLSRAYKGVDILVDKKNVWHVSGIPQSPEEALRKVDVVFNTIRGEYGEDGKLQRILETLSIPFVGSRSYPSSIAHNKSKAKEHFKIEGIKTPYFKEFNLEKHEDLYPIAHNLFHTFPMPVVVKPRNMGSSVGVSYASSFAELIQALEHARGFSPDVIVEEYLSGKEIVSGFIENFRGQDLYNLFPVEIKPHNKKALFDEIADQESAKITVDELSEKERELLQKINQAGIVDPEHVREALKKKLPPHPIFDWSAKNAGAFDHQSPAILTQAEKDEVWRSVQSARKALDLKHFATADFKVSPRRGVYLLEVNTSPGIHEHSPVYSALDAAGIRHHEFLEHLIKLALESGK